MEIICVPFIVSAVYGLVETYKLIVKNKKDFWLKLIPVIALVIGGLLGIAMFLIAPQFIVADNIWFALIVGMCSGLSATGTNQLWRQLRKIGIEVKNTETEENKNENNSEK